MPGDNYSILLHKLDEFIRKFYKNSLIRGSIYALSIVLATYLSFTFLEYYGQFNSAVRAIIFFSFLLVLLFVLYRFIWIPLRGLLKLGKVLSHEEASSIIGKHFPEVSDKLLNTLQLHSLAGSSQNELLLASINQKITQLKPIPFVQAINLKENLRYLRFLYIPIGALLLVLIFNSNIVTDGTERLVKYNETFEKRAPFRFELQNKDLLGVQNEDIEIKVLTEGQELPAEVYLHLDGRRYKMLSDAPGEHHFTVKNIQKSFDFYFWADEFTSRENHFEVVSKPVLSGFNVKLDYPNYTGLKDESLKNMGDLTIPEGTQVEWNIETRNTDFLELLFEDSLTRLDDRGSGRYQYGRKFFHSGTYYLRSGSKGVNQKDSVAYRVNVKPDAYPAILVEEKKDSTQALMTYFIGEASDDYGLSKLNFCYRFVKSEKRSAEMNRIAVPLDKSRKEQQFYHIWDLKQLNLKPGEHVEYYFELSDNDGIHGAKTVKSKVQVFEVPTERELREENKQRSEDLKDKMEEAIKETKDLSKDWKELQRKMLDKKNLDWQDKNKMDKLLKRQDELKKKLDELKQENKEKNQRQNEFTPQQQEIMQKQQQLEKMFDELFDDELKKMMEELQKLMMEENKEKMNEELEKMELNEKELNKELDRMLELYKKFEIEQGMQDQIDKLDELSKKQEELAKETENKEKSPEELQQAQDSLNKEFDDLKEELDRLDSLNKELEDPLDLDMPEEEDLNDIDQDMEQSQKELKEGKNSKASQKQKDAASKMQKMSKSLGDMMSSQEQEQQQEDYESLRMLLENLVQLSFDQEALMEEFGAVTGYSPKFIELVQQQKKIADDARLVEDSLLALSKRIMMLSGYINEEIGKVNQNMSRSMGQLSQRNSRTARVSQQYTMTHLNNLAVMISDVLKNMQEDMMQSSGSGGGSSKKPKKGNSKSMKKMKEMQKQLGDELKKMRGKMQNGQQPGSEGWARMAAQQEQIRRMMQDAQKQLRESGENGAAQELQKTIDEMEKLEKDLVNKKLNPETINRHQEIETRMLEHEKAEQEREKDPKRESKEGQQQERQLPPVLEEYLKQKQKEAELLQQVPPKLRPYYKEKTREYFREIAR
ncbi:MAG: DUF4175 domain-containing protein [Bacteroidetes bacterium]|nr:MAG: DUF4175 domain-containing protein [Bacteroidota bacterium]